MRKSRVLMFYEDLDGDEVGRTVVVDEPGDVAVLVGVDAEGFAAILERRMTVEYYLSNGNHGSRFVLITV